MKKLLLLFISVAFLQTLNAQLIISEIFYNAPNAGTDSLEFVEFYNNGTTAVKLKGYYFKNAFVDTLPDETIAAGKYYVVANNAAYFKSKFGKDCRQWISGGLNNTGELIELWTANGVLADSARYSSANSWPQTPNGGGASLVVCNPNDNNDLASSWTACTVPSSAKIDGRLLFVTPFEANCTAGTVVVAVDDAVNNTVNKTRKIGVLINDTHTNPVTITNVTTPANGTTSINSQKDSIIYTPKKDFCGVDEFNYTISDGTLISTATVKVTTTGCLVVTTIKELRKTDTNGNLTANTANVYEISGIVNSINFRATGFEFPLIDSNGDGVGIFSTTKTFGYSLKEGDLLTVRGKIANFNGYAQVTADTLFKTGTGAVAIPKVVSVLSESTESQIVTLKNVTLVDPSKWVAPTGTTNFFLVEVTDGTNKTAVRIDRETNVFTMSAPTGKFDLTGVGYQFDNSSPYTDGYQLNPRYTKDIKLIVAANDVVLGNDISIYPNPVNEKLQVNLNTTIERLTITDMIGRIVYINDSLASNLFIDTNNWNTGVYVASFIKGASVFSAKIIKQ